MCQSGKMQTASSGQQHQQRHGVVTKGTGQGDRVGFITYFVKEGLQGLVIASRSSPSLAGHVGLYASPLQRTTGPHQAQIGQPLLYCTHCCLKIVKSMQSIELASLQAVLRSSSTLKGHVVIHANPLQGITEPRQV